MIIFKTKNEQVTIKGDEYTIQWGLKELKDKKLFDAIVIETPYKRYSFVDINEKMEMKDAIYLEQAIIAYIEAHISDSIICVDFEKLAKEAKLVDFNLYIEKV